MADRAIGQVPGRGAILGAVCSSCGESLQAELRARALACVPDVTAVAVARERAAELEEQLQLSR